MEPTKLGGYDIREVLGEGGMGKVYLAHDPTLDRPAALKVIRAKALSSEGKSRFLREARACSKINHPNIITVYAAGEDNGTPYMAMELIDGRTLRDVINEGPTDWRTATRWVVDLLDALARLHREGIVHRDLKPENIMVTKDGVVKLMDFGLVHLQSTTTLTQEGTTLGTVPYMSPEQVLGNKADASSDMFSLATIYYELLTGNHPFRGEHPMAVMYSIQTETPAPVTLPSGEKLPALQPVLDRAFQKDADKRFPDASAFRDALGVLLPELSGSGITPAMPASSKAPRALTIGVLITVAMVAIGFAAWKIVENRRGSADRAYAVNLNEMGQDLERSGDFAAARMKYREAIVADPDYAISWNNLGFLALRDGDLAEADSLFRRAVELDPEYPVALFNLGNLRFGMGGETAAEEYFTRAIAADSSFAAAYNQLGVLQLEAQRAEEARATLQRGLAAGDQNVEPFLLKNLGKVAAARGDNEKARAYWTRALEESPNDEELKSLLAALD